MHSHITPAIICTAGVWRKPEILLDVRSSTKRRETNPAHGSGRIVQMQPKEEGTTKQIPGHGSVRIVQLLPTLAPATAVNHAKADTQFLLTPGDCPVISPTTG